MIVIVLTAVPIGLRGLMTRWLLEVAPGVFVGHLPARARDLLWDRIVEMAGSGRAMMIHSTTGEQRLAFKVHGHDWVPTDHEGIQLMLRPSGQGSSQRPPPERWSIASRRRRFGGRLPRAEAE